MLDLIRKKQKTFIIKVVFWAIIAAFVGTIFLVWGRGSGRDKGDPNVAVTVNGTKIGFDNYQNVYNNLLKFYQNAYRGRFTPEVQKKLHLKKQALDTVINQGLLLQEAKNLGLSVSRKELVSQIAKIPAFQVDGSFNKSRYLRVLAYQRMTPDEFETSEKQQLLLQKVRENILAGVTVTPDDVTKAYRRQNEKISLEFLKLNPALFEGKVKADAKALATFYADHQEEFRIPEKAAIRYIQFKPSLYEKDVVFKKGDLKKYYDQNIDKFEVPERVKAAHILIRVPEGASAPAVKKKRALAEKILKEAKAGKNFAQLARKYSQDPGSASKGGELGYFARGTMVPAFEKVAFRLRPGQISGIVKTRFGFDIIKVEAHQDSGIKPLKEVLDAVKKGLREQQATQIAYGKAMDAYNMNRKGGSLEAAAKANGLKIEQTGYFDRQGPIPGLGEATDVIADAFSLQPGKLAHPANLPQGVVLFTVKDRKESRIPKLSEVRPQVEKAWRKEKAKEMAQSEAKALLAQLHKGKKLTALARRKGLRVTDTGLFTRATGAFIPRLGPSTDLTKAAFALTAKKPVAPDVYSVGGDFVVAVLKNRQDADMKALDKTERAQLRESLLNQKQDDALAARLKELRKKANIVISPTMQNSLQEG